MKTTTSARRLVLSPKDIQYVYYQVSKLPQLSEIFYAHGNGCSNRPTESLFFVYQEVVYRFKQLLYICNII